MHRLSAAARLVTRHAALVTDLYRFFRFSAFGATAALPLLGAAGARPNGRRAFGLLGVAACFHAFAYVHNDVCDLELDRTQPLRARYPLVRGAISPRTALAIALACVPAAFALDRWLAGLDAGRRPDDQGRKMTGEVQLRVHSSCCSVRPASVALALAFALLAAYNRWGKLCPLPPLTDALQGLGWAALICYGGAAAGGGVRLARHLALYELLLILLVNGVHGALRDLSNDAARGARTTALLLGARAGSAGELQISPALAAYAVTLQLAMLAVLARALATNALGHSRAERAWAAAGVGLTAAGLVALALAAARGGATPGDLGMLHLIFILSAPVALSAPGMAATPRALLLAAHSLPLLANGMTYAALRWLVCAGAR